MPRFVAFLRGVTPANANMAALRQCFAQAGFDRVATVLASGNVVFDAAQDDEDALARRCEAAMQAALGHHFFTIVRSVEALRLLLETDPYAAHDVPVQAKRVVSFLPAAVPPRVGLPLQADGAAVLYQAGREVFTAYMPGPKGPVFMRLIEKAFGTDVTTRTWATVHKCVLA